MSKIKLNDKKFLSNVYTIIGIVGSVASIVSLVITMPGWWKLVSLFVVLVPFFIVLLMYISVSRKKSARFRINQTEINIFEGDIFKEEPNSINVIPFNEYFDTTVDDKIIAERSLHGMYIKKYWNGREEELSNIIKNDFILNKSKTTFNSNREVGNKQKYELGSMISIKNFVLTALTHFDEDNRAYLSFSDYICFLVSFWKHIDVIYANRVINIPIFGSGITRINDKKVTIELLLETILWSIKDSSFQGKKINILVYKEDLYKIDFYHLEPKIY